MPFQKISKLEPLRQSVKDLLSLWPEHMVRVTCKGIGYEGKAQGRVRKLNTKARMRKQWKLT